MSLMLPPEVLPFLMMFSWNLPKDIPKRKKNF